MLDLELQHMSLVGEKSFQGWVSLQNKLASPQVPVGNERTTCLVNKTLQ